MTRDIKRLLYVANSIKSTDPVGAALIKRMASMLRRNACANCQNAYSRGYTAGLKAGRKEWN